MKLRMTGYKSLACPHAKRVEMADPIPSAKSLLRPWRYPPKCVLHQLDTFIKNSKHEHQAIYFWMTHD